MNVMFIIIGIGGLVAFVVIVGVFALLGVKIAKPNERLAIFRLGILRGILGPGLVIILPGMDKAEKVELDKHFPGWENLDPRELRRKVAELVQGGRNV